ncbi:hypothetical protein TVAG_205340 [Trichomonas vaginalis G3]|uniref:DUF3447 domain-containing protein n=1 Tax=Trichomonas vaginalis (strain ATCC PRA-98 / G3) TaxID=412133 RepID=A2FFR4_TRIV3|nr:spectrin binding [Trichomonas vaginalis G3]EAX96248.1 hypothetical protein TVAG_205340 [Trichomonas vaginalis G3]KAI5516244.1 spectrin binding [Trichomonas vaginalis G3]|eukprot:XP_001309178.1 hypothetical protein [Trichomonas vaginalis G3]
MKMSQAIRASETLLKEYKGYIDTWDAIYKLDTDEINSTAGLYEDIKNNLIDTGYFTAKEMIELIARACNEGLHYRHGYIELMKKISEGYFVDNMNISQYNDIKINTPEYAIINDNEEELLYHLTRKRFSHAKILEKCCLRGAINCFMLMRQEFNVKITKECLDASFRGNNKRIINECLKGVKPDQRTMQAAIASHNFDNVEKLYTEYRLSIDPYSCSMYLNLYEFIFFLDDSSSHDLSLGLFTSPHFRIPSLCEYLIKNGANINYNVHSHTVLYVAAIVNQTDIVSTLLLNGFDCSFLDGSELDYAISNNNSAMVELLVSYGSNVNYRSEKDQLTILHNACAKNNIKAPNILISHGANINDNNNIGKLTPLMVVTTQNHRDIIKLLISHGADINMQEYRGYSAIHLAIIANRRGKTNEDAEYLEKMFGLDLIKDFVNDSEVNDLIELLLSNGANVNAKNFDGLTPLHLASLLSTKEIVEILISHGAEINPISENELTPLDVAIRREKIDYEKYLILRENNMDYQYYLDSSQEAIKIQALLKSHGGKTNSQDTREAEEL